MTKEYKKTREGIVEITETNIEKIEKTIYDIDDEISMVQKTMDSLLTEKTAIENALK